MRVYILNLGWLESERSNLVQNAPKEHVKLPVMAILIEHPEGKILYDLGCHPLAMQGYWPENIRKIFPFFMRQEQSLPAQLALCHTDVSEIKTIVLSHMHLDHAGNLALFSQAEVYVHKADLAYGLRCVGSESMAARDIAYIKADLKSPVKKYHLVEEDFELASGVQVITLPGHTPGVLGLMVHLPNSGVMIFPQDCIYTAENYGPPIRYSGIMYDLAAYEQSIEKVRALAERYSARVIFAHDMDFFQTLKLAPQFYE